MSPETAKGLNFIKKAELIEEKGAPAYTIVGQVDLQHVVHAPLDEADKNIPTEAAKLLSPVITDVYGTGRITAQQLTTLMRHMKIDGDNHHCVYEKKLNRKYVTRAGIKAAEDYIRKHPGEALEAFGSKASRSDYLLKVLPGTGREGHCHPVSGRHSAGRDAQHFRQGEVVPLGP